MGSCKLCGGTDISVIHKGTRDRQDIDVLKCNQCGLVFLSQIATDDLFYSDSKMHSGIDFAKWRDNTRVDDNRRFFKYKGLIKGKAILDFGCGNGGFLELVTRQEAASRVVGIDLDKESVGYIRSRNIECYDNILNVPDVKFDIVFLFHVIEHLTNPEKVLGTLFEHMADNGVIIIETPNADDALLSIYGCEKFADFTYWSPHIYLYNENTLSKMLTSAGYKVIAMLQEQRYPLANHLRWLSKGLPGGGIKEFKALNDSELNNAYAKALAGEKACDTLTCTIRRA